MVTPKKKSSESIFNTRTACFVNGLVIPLLIYYLYIIMTTVRVEGKVTKIMDVNGGSPYTLIIEQDDYTLTSVVMYDNLLLAIDDSYEKRLKIKEGLYFKFIVSGAERGVWRMK